MQEVVDKIQKVYGVVLGTNVRYNHQTNTTQVGWKVKIPLWKDKYLTPVVKEGKRK